MKRIFITGCLVIAGVTLRAQSSSVNNAVKIRRTDSLIIATIISPEEQQAGEDSREPDWASLSPLIKTKYSAEDAERSITKAKIYFYYGKDWPEFNKALVLYTVKYEDKNDLRLMNINANYILKFSSDPEELKTALGWIKPALEKEPGNQDYKKTYDALNTKITSN